MSVLVDSLLTVAVVIGGGVALAGAVWRAARRPTVAATGARLLDSPLGQLFGVAAAVGVLALAAAVATLFDLPLGVAGLALLGPALLGYTHLGVLAAAHGYRQLGLDREALVDSAAGTTRGGAGGRLTAFMAGFTAWTTFVTERYRALPVALVALSIVAVPTAVVLAGPAGEWPLWAGAVVAVEALALSIATGYRRRLPQGPEERVRDALAAAD